MHRPPLATFPSQFRYLVAPIGGIDYRIERGRDTPPLALSKFTRYGVELSSCCVMSFFLSAQMLICATLLWAVLPCYFISREGWYQTTADAGSGAAAQKDFDGSAYSDTGEGTMYLATAGGTSEVLFHFSRGLVPDDGASKLYRFTYFSSSYS